MPICTDRIGRTAVRIIFGTRKQISSTATTSASPSSSTGEVGARISIAAVVQMRIIVCGVTLTLTTFYWNLEKE